MFMVELEPLPGKSIFEMSPSMPLVWVDHMLGGPGGKQPDRPLTDIETPLITGVLERVLDELRYSFESIVAIAPRVVGVEYNPQFAQAAAASDAVIIVSFEMRVGAEECIATVCTPFAGLLPHLNPEAGSAGLSAAQRQARDAAQRSMTMGLGNTPVEVSVRFNSVLMSPRDLIALQPGDIVPLEHRSRTRWPSPRPGSRSRTPWRAAPDSAWPASSCPRPRRTVDDDGDRRSRASWPRGEAAVRLLPAPTPARPWARRPPTGRPVRPGDQRPVRRVRAGQIVVVVGSNSSGRWRAARSARSTSTRRSVRRWRRPRPRWPGRGRPGHRGRAGRRHRRGPGRGRVAGSADRRGRGPALVASRHRATDRRVRPTPMPPIPVRGRG